MKLTEYLTEAFVKKQLEPKEGNTYSVKGTTSDGEDIYQKNMRFIGKVKKDGDWVYDFRQEDKNVHYTIKKPFVLGPR